MANNTRGLRPLVLCGPSGTGKSTLLKKLLEDYPNTFGFSVSHTTRLPRPGEIDGKHYHFTTAEKMKQDIEEGKFIENATFGGNMYGTSKDAVKTVLDQGKVCVLDIDVQGVKQIKKTDLNPFYVFIKPPNLNVLEERLRQRKTETEETLKRRLSVASHEVQYGEEPGNFDLVVLNDNLEHAYDQLKKFVKNHVLNGKQGK
ncbi:guanylate kinase-like [Agrilus planipennis]|uniref:guanylate kinase n=1 Tax=Agrilus planipennis TaxID=224129 RepID=A0A1W4XVA1_AGRPL|nr:guanylate kinase [Agrilus planipennis]XP_025837565.1 guanylate kinase-like [Agrilus planipennis]XP_025837566.1 guanylate kinase-like [Agrilus planipennis]